MRLLVLVLLTCSVAFAAYVQPKKIKWTNSTSPDVVSHRLFVVPEADTIDPLNSTHVDVAMPNSEYNLPGTFSISDGNYKVGLCAIDGTGNMSDVVEITYFFDFNPPAPPSAVQVVNL